MEFSALIGAFIFLVWVVWVVLYWSRKTFNAGRRLQVKPCPQCGTLWDYKGLRPSPVISHCDNCRARLGLPPNQPSQKRAKGWALREIEAERLLKEDEEGRITGTESTQEDAG
jgi:hypothetical protein